MAHIPISFGGQVGDLDKITAEASDVVKPKIIVDKDGNALSGTLDDYSGTAKQAAIGLDHGNSRLQMRIPASGKYGTTSTLYTAYPDVRNAIGLSGDKLWPGASVLGTGSSRSSMNGQTVTPSASRQTIACNGKAMNGDIIVNGDANLTGGNIVKGRTIFGVTGTKTWSYKVINACAWYWTFASEHHRSEENTFVMPSDGVVYYDGCSAAATGVISHKLICEIYKNDIRMDERNMGIDSDKGYILRTTMFNKSFAASKGDVIKVKAEIKNSYNMLAWITATIIYFT